MTVYNITHTDPLLDGFQIAAGSFNGPGGAETNSTLRLYGRGALEWGEAVDEDLVRLAENFSGATPPAFPLGGQLWFSAKLYWTDGTNWYRFDPDQITPGSSWTLITPVSITTRPAVPAVGQYWYATVPSGNDAFGQLIKINTLYRWDSAYAQQSPGWMERIHTVSGVAPVNDVDFPVHSLVSYDKVTGTWITPPLAITSADIGALAADGSVVATGNLDMGAFRIVNLADPTNPQDALTLSFADTRYVNTAGDTMGGYLILNANPVSALGAATKQYVDTAVGAVSGYMPLAGGTMTGDLVLFGAAPAGATSATPKSYVDAGLRPDPGTVGTPTAPKYYFSTSAPSGGSDGDVWFQYV